jgi:hypothetical protein
MSEGNTFAEPTAAFGDAASDLPVAVVMFLGIPVENNFLLNRLDLPLADGSVQQADIRAYCAKQIST